MFAIYFVISCDSEAKHGETCPGRLRSTHEGSMAFTLVIPKHLLGTLGVGYRFRAPTGPLRWRNPFQSHFGNTAKSLAKRTQTQSLRIGIVRLSSAFAGGPQRPRQFVAGARCFLISLFPASCPCFCWHAAAVSCSTSIRSVCLPRPVLDCIVSGVVTPLAFEAPLGFLLS